MLTIHPHTALIPTAIALIDAGDRLAIAGNVRNFLTTNISGEWAHDLIDGQSRFSFEDEADAEAFADQFNTTEIELTEIEEPEDERD